VGKKKHKGLRLRKGARIRGIKVEDADSRKKVLKLLKAEAAMRAAAMDVDADAAGAAAAAAKASGSAKKKKKAAGPKVRTKGLKAAARRAANSTVGAAPMES